MLETPWLNQIWQMFSPRQWLAITVLCGLLAFGSGLFLTVSAGWQLAQPWASWYDNADIFIRDTIRLTFRDRSRRGGRRTAALVFTAPPGILDPRTQFHWPDAVVPVESEASEDQPAVVRPSARVVGAPVKTPASLLDPSWRPDFNQNNQN